MASRSNPVLAQSFDVDDTLHNPESRSLPSASHPTPARRFSPTKVDRRNRLFQELHFDIPNFCVGLYLRLVRFTLEHKARTMEEEEGVEMAVFKG